MYSIFFGLLLVVLSVRAAPAPLLFPRADPSDVIAGKYIVKLKDGSNAASIDGALAILSTTEGADHVFSGVFKGFSATIDKASLDALRNHSSVDYIEQDSTVYATSFVTQKNAQYSLARLSTKKTVTADYTYDSTAGSGTCSYVMDTGVEDSHPEFQNRANQIKSFIEGELIDGNGHGTHIAGIIGGKTYGVAKKTKIFGVKVLDDSARGTWSGVIAGMDFIVKDATARKASCPKGVLVNMSIGGARNLAVNRAAAAMVSKGIFVAVASGASAEDVSNTSPASEPSVCTVGTIHKGPIYAPYSDFGPLIDILAVGGDVKSAWIGGTTATLSGTSQAAAHITGLAAYFNGLGRRYGLCGFMKSIATNGIVRNMPPDTVNKIAFNDNPAGK